MVLGIVGRRNASPFRSRLMQIFMLNRQHIATSKAQEAPAKKGMRWKEASSALRVQKFHTSRSRAEQTESKGCRRGIVQSARLTLKKDEAKNIQMTTPSEAQRMNQKTATYHISLALHFCIDALNFQPVAVPQDQESLELGCTSGVIVDEVDFARVNMTLQGMENHDDHSYLLEGEE